MLGPVFSLVISKILVVTISLFSTEIHDLYDSIGLFFCCC